MILHCLIINLTNKTLHSITKADFFLFSSKVQNGTFSELICQKAIIRADRSYERLSCSKLISKRNAFTVIQLLKKLKISIYIILEITIAILCTVKYRENKKELLIVLELQINKEKQKN